ncbi:hypothetical protein C1N53_09605 [Pontibacter sp. SGAir0037]|nr:hypothetical protein C1N53_09605 [Pontibacter sp. SGAir0037]
MNEEFRANLSYQLFLTSIIKLIYFLHKSESTCIDKTLVYDHSFRLLVAIEFAAPAQRNFML